MDVSLGEMDGWEAAKILRADPRTQAIPIVALTGHALESERKKALEAGCIDFEVKPISLSGLIEKIDKYAIRH
jgi:CheY-like chemotaxis protein